MTYWDLTNVDGIGMLCGMTSNDPGLTKCGYKQPQTQFSSSALSASGLTTSSTAWKGCGPKEGKSYKYHKLLGPTLCPDQYSSKYTDYLNLLKTNGVKITLYSDDTTKDPDHSGPGLKSSSFTGQFSNPKTIDNVKNVVLKLTSEPNFATELYFTTDALNGNTVVTGNSAKGLYVKKGGDFIAKDVSINWINSGPVSATTRLQAWVDSVSSRGIICALNCGEIPTTKDSEYDQKDQSTWVPAEKTKYGNPYNNYIVQNSNSYGMAYSDAAHSKVQFLTSNNITVDLYLLAANDPDTSKYYNPDAGKGGNAGGNYEMGIPPELGKKATVDGQQVDSNQPFNPKKNPSIITFPTFSSAELKVDFKAQKIVNPKDWQNANACVWSKDPETGENNAPAQWCSQTNFRRIIV